LLRLRKSLLIEAIDVSHRKPQDTNFCSYRSSRESYMHEYGRLNLGREQEAADDSRIDALADWEYIEKAALNGKRYDSFIMSTEKSQGMT
jgi:hypothetical protein